MRKSGWIVQSVRQIEIPAGRYCLMDDKSACKLASWSEWACGYSCRLYGEMLSGEEMPERCEKCKEEDRQRQLTEIYAKRAYRT